MNKKIRDLVEKFIEDLEAEYQNVSSGTFRNSFQEVMDKLIEHNQQNYQKGIYKPDTVDEISFIALKTGSIENLINNIDKINKTDKIGFIILEHSERASEAGRIIRLQSALDELYSEYKCFGVNLLAMLSYKHKLDARELLMNLKHRTDIEMDIEQALAEEEKKCQKCQRCLNELADFDYQILKDKSQIKINGLKKLKQILYNF